MTDQMQELQNLLSKGNSAAWDQNWNDAVTYYQQALEIEPDNFKALTNIGLAYFEMHEYHEAINVYSKAIELNAEDPAPYEKMYLIYEALDQPTEAVKSALHAAESHLKNEDIQKAIENWKRVVELDLHNIKAHARLGMVYERLGKKKMAVSEYINTAGLLQLSGNIEKANESIERALQCSPENIIALRAREILAQGRQLPLPEPIIKDQDEEIQLDVAQLSAPEPTKPTVYDDPIVEAVDKAMIVLAEALFEEQIFEGSQKTQRNLELDQGLSWNVDDAASLTDDSLLKLHVSQAIENFSAGNDKEAAEHIKSATDAGYSNPAAYFLLGYLYIKLGRTESAVRSLTKSVSHENFALASRLLLANQHSTAEEWVEASKEYLEALRIADTSLVDKEEVEDLIHLYEVMMDDLEQREGNDAYIEMSKHIEELLLRPDWRDILTDLRTKGRTEGGILLPQMDALLDDRRSQIINIHRDIIDLTSEGLYGAAMEKAFFALKNAPSFLPLHITIGDILVEQDKISGAVAKYLAVGDVYAVQGKTERALVMLKKVIDLQPMNVEVRQRQIDLLEEFGKKEEAINEYINLAEVFFPLAELDSARAAYTKALALAKTIPDDGGIKQKLLHRLADIDIQRLDWEAAINTYQDICESSPQNQKASISLVDLNYRLGKKADAEQEINRYTDQYDISVDSETIHGYLAALRDEIPGEIFIVRRLVDLFKHLGQRELAIGELDKLGDYLLDSGQREAAVDVIAEIITLNPPNIEAYKQLLEQLRS